MKNLLHKLTLVLGFIFITNCDSKAQGDIYYAEVQPYDSIEPILLLQDARPFLVPRFPDQNPAEEINYIRDGVSNVNIIYLNNNVYISWNVCDDSSNSVFIIKKTIGDSKEETAGVVQNIPCSPLIPLGYSIQDKNVILNKTHVYKLFKILENGSTVHIITMILPKEKNTKTAIYNN